MKQIAADHRPYNYTGSIVGILITLGALVYALQTSFSKVLGGLAHLLRSLA